jgi:hypothetical protein
MNLVVCMYGFCVLLSSHMFILNTCPTFMDIVKRYRDAILALSFGLGSSEGFTSNSKGGNHQKPLNARYGGARIKDDRWR